MNIFHILEQIITGTPIYVWILLLFLIRRGLNASKATPLNIPKMLIIPIVFSVWGLDELFSHFTSPLFYFCFYLLFAIIGTIFGYFLYESRRKIYISDNKILCSGTFMPLIIILINFTIKYVLGVLLAIQPSLYSNASFEILYTVASGLSVGLFIGGFFQALLAYKRLLSTSSYLES